MTRWSYLLSGLLLSVVGHGQASQGGNGLRGEYYNGPAFNRKALVRTDKLVDFSWDGYTLPAPGVTPNSFSVRWTGKIYAPVSGPYKFTAVVDDGIRIWVDGKLAMDEWRYRKQKIYGQAVNLKAGQFYNLKIEYYNASNGGYVQLNWNLVNEQGRNPAFEEAPQQKVSAQYLYNGPPLKPVPPAPKPKPKQVPPPIPVIANKPRADTPRPIAARPKPIPPRPSPVQALSMVTTTLPEATATEMMIMRRIAFAQSDYQLMPSAFEVLDKLVRIMTRDTTARLSIEGHTDDTGDPRLNVTLSEYRVKVVRFYLCRQGVPEHRMNLIGYGGAQPIVPNTTEANRAKNRRVELCLWR